MKKEKIAISMDKELLNLIDSKVDREIIRSRSQAIEVYLKRGLMEGGISTVVLLLKGNHQRFAIRRLDQEVLIRKQARFFARQGIKQIYLVTQHSPYLMQLTEEIKESEIPINIFEKDAKGNAQALFSLKGILRESFIVMSGDIYNEFDLKQMIKKHQESGKIATMGLMLREKPSEYGNVILDGDLIVDFEEKPKKLKSFIVNAGIYIFQPSAFEYISEKITSLEKDLFPVLAKNHQLVGFFTHGIYHHFV